MYHYTISAAKGALLRFLIVSDIHSNLEALESVIEHACVSGGFDQIWHLGDVVGYGPDPAGCIDLLMAYDHIGVAGNHDLAAVGRLGLEMFNPQAAEAARWTADQLDDDHIEYLCGLPTRVRLHDFTAVHASPRDPVWEYVDSPENAAPNFDHFDTRRCLVGHSHLPFVCKQNGDAATFYPFPVHMAINLGKDRYIINPGSVGQPRDGLPTSSYAIFDSEASTITHLRVGYDIPATQKKMRKSGLPAYLIDRLDKGR